MKTLAMEMREHLDRVILPFWKGLKDDVHGGYTGYVGQDLKRDPGAVKGCILNSRILWFFSQAVITLEDRSLLPYAEHAYDMLCRMIDIENGGVFWAMNADGSVADGIKHTYNQAFAVYALATYSKASGDRGALEKAFGLFRVIEKHCTDEIGYLEAFTPDWQPESNEHLSENGVMAGKTMNTLLHVLEAYTALYDVSRDKAVEERLRFILNVWDRHVWNPALKRQEVFFDSDYNTLIDLHSYGHDIETSWLADRALEVLDDPALTARIRPKLQAMAIATSEIAYTGHGFRNECERGVINEERIWWVQAETTVAFVHLYQRTGDSQWLDKAREEWEFIKNVIADHREGSEWFWSVDVNDVPTPVRAIADPWKCPYHNGRMVFEIIERSRHAQL